MKTFFTVILTLILCTSHVNAQKLAFVIQAPQGITVTPIGDSELNFGDYLLPNMGTVQINLQDTETEVIRIDLDWFRWFSRRNRNLRVTITPPNNLRLDFDVIPYSLGAAYNDQTEDNNPNQAQPFQGTSEVLTMPNPGLDGQWWNSTAYIYIYGNINIGNVKPGRYTGTININVDYAN